MSITKMNILIVSALTFIYLFFSFPFLPVPNINYLKYRRKHQWSTTFEFQFFLPLFGQKSKNILKCGVTEIFISQGEKIKIKKKKKKNG